MLRGGEDGPNYDDQHVLEAERQLEQAGLAKAILIDCSHGNSGKDANRQPDVLRYVAGLRASGTASVFGAMLESNLHAGSQPFPRSPESLVYGQSITDACIAWEATERVILEVADRL